MFVMFLPKPTGDANFTNEAANIARYTRFANQFSHFNADAIIYFSLEYTQYFFLLKQSRGEMCCVASGPVTYFPRL